MDIGPDQAEFHRYLTVARRYWNLILPRDRRRTIVVEAFHNNIRVQLRVLTLANALRHVIPARMIVLTGVDPHWHESLGWDNFDINAVRDMAEAFGADEIIDVHAIADRRLPDEAPEPASLAADPGFLDECAAATVCRIDKTPRVSPDQADHLGYRRNRCAALSAVFDPLMVDAAAFVTSHVDYDQWGTATHCAMRRRIPIMFVQSTGQAKAYMHFPERSAGDLTLRGELTREVGKYFEDNVWANRDRFRIPAERVTWRVRENYGRPAWWKKRGAELGLRTDHERAQVRKYAAGRFGFDPWRPTVAVFNHAVSDALGTNVETFNSLAEWFESTTTIARSVPEANWLFLDHPSQYQYDVTGHFERTAERFADYAHMAFVPSPDISKDALWSLADLGLTVRGSIGNELPAFGFPVIQAGWSEWSACGLNVVATDRDDYHKAVLAAIERLNRGERLIDPEQIERARLWLWFYRSMADVSTPIIPPWRQRQFWATLRENLESIESDGDPLFEAVTRMWNRRDPLITRPT